MENDNELQDSTTPDDEQQEDLSDLADDEVAKEDQQKQEDTIETLKEKNRKLFERAKKAEEKLKKEKPDVEQRSSPTSVDPDLIDTKVELRLAGHNSDEIKFMENYARGSNKKLSEVSNLPEIKSAIEGMRNKKKTDQGTPAPSPRSGGQPSGEEKKPFAKLSRPEQQKAWRERLEAQKAKNTGGQFE